MFNNIAQELNLYQKEYNQFIYELDSGIDRGSNKNANNIESGCHLNSYNSKIAQILKYPSLDLNKNKIFIVTPSILNSVDILFLSRKKSENLIANLQKFGDVYLINWLENTEQLLMENYISEIKKIILHLSQIIDDQNKKFNLVGHCIAGAFCVAIASQLQDSKSAALQQISSLILLSCPWDYSHFNHADADADHLSNIINHLEFIPPIYIQMIFFLISPMKFIQKIKKFHTLNPDQKKLFFKIEQWLQSGISISKSLYNEVLEELYKKNSLLNQTFLLNNEIINPQNISVPVHLVCGINDEIVPLSSTMSLYNQIPNAKMIKCQGGHLSYLINGSLISNRNYQDWLAS